SVLETARLRDYLAAYVPLASGALASGAGRDGNHLGETLVRGIGRVGLGVAGAGTVWAAVARERTLVPLGAFLALYLVVLVQTPLALARYALPVAGPLAVFAAYGLAKALPPAARIAAVTGLVAVGLPSCLDYVRVLAQEDTRVEAARLLTAERA